MEQNIKQELKGESGATDNFKGSTARMSDGRFMTNYKSNCILNNTFKGQLNSYEYRQSLINNTTQIMDMIHSGLEDNYSCKDCHEIAIPKARYKQDCHGPSCMIYDGQKDGIGIEQV
ncbi:MAG: hypothetical protein CMH79_04205 [Nitrospinae bacterium]|nr:hypothetical protein [Nitrospinota bacterium]|tara:strand:+ start:418 stop:768 length:351 start_codon:yes stop_codon:yes gene_type:complete